MRASRISVKPRFWIYVMIATLLLFGVLFSLQSGVMDNQFRQIEQLERQRAARLEENEQLTSRINFSKTEEYIERYARSELGLLKEGEIRFVSGSTAE